MKTNLKAGFILCLLASTLACNSENKTQESGNLEQTNQQITKNVPNSEKESAEAEETKESLENPKPKDIFEINSVYLSKPSVPVVDKSPSEKIDKIPVAIPSDLPAPQEPTSPQTGNSETQKVTESVASQPTGSPVIATESASSHSTGSVVGNEVAPEALPNEHQPNSPSLTQDSVTTLVSDATSPDEATHDTSIQEIEILATASRVPSDSPVSSLAERCREIVSRTVDGGRYYLVTPVQVICGNVNNQVRAVQVRMVDWLNRTLEDFTSRGLSFQFPFPALESPSTPHSDLNVVAESSSQPVRLRARIQGRFLEMFQSVRTGLNNVGTVVFLAFGMGSPEDLELTDAQVQPVDSAEEQNDGAMETSSQALENSHRSNVSESSETSQALQITPVAELSTTHAQLAPQSMWSPIRNTVGTIGSTVKNGARNFWTRMVNYYQQMTQILTRNPAES